MTIKLTQYHQSILNKMGITLWISKNNPIQQMPIKSFNRLNIKNDLNAYQPTDNTSVNVINPSVNTMTVTNHFVADNKNHAVIDNIIDSPVIDNNIIKNIDNDNKTDDIINNADNIINTPYKNTQQIHSYLSTIDIVSKTWSLSAMRFGQWLLMIDNAMLNTQDKSLFENLYRKLQVRHTVIMCHATYPIHQDDKINKSKAIAVLSGFLFGLIQNDNTTIKIALLSPMGIMLGELNNRVVRVPSLIEMYYRPQLKKVLWDMLHE